jgi:hypothetical protein
LELHIAMTCIIIPLGQLLGLQKTLANLCQDLIPGSKKSISSFSTRRPWRVGQQRWRRPTIDDLEGSGTQGGVEGGIIAILRPREPVHPCTRAIARHTAQVHGDHFVDYLILAICLRVERRTHAEFNASHPEEIPPHVPDKHVVPVTDNGESPMFGVGN